MTDEHINLNKQFKNQISTKKSLKPGRIRTMNKKIQSNSNKAVATLNIP